MRGICWGFWGKLGLMEWARMAYRSPDDGNRSAELGESKDHVPSWNGMGGNWEQIRTTGDNSIAEGLS